jgi:hypothetical protein
MAATSDNDECIADFIVAGGCETVISGNGKKNHSGSDRYKKILNANTHASNRDFCDFGLPRSLRVAIFKLSQNFCPLLPFTTIENS